MAGQPGSQSQEPAGKPITGAQAGSGQTHRLYLKTSSITDLMTLQQCCGSRPARSLPPLELNGQLLPRYVCLDRPPPLFGASKPLPFLQEFHQLLDLHKQDPALDIQVVPVTLFWGRAPGPGRQGGLRLEHHQQPGAKPPEEALIVILKGARTWCASPPPLPALHGGQARHRRGHRPQAGAGGPHPLQPPAAGRHRTQVADRNLLFKQLLDSSVIQQAIEEEARREGISLEKAQKRAHGYMDEIASNFPIG